MSNYPPGVTGNEYEIAGGEEVELTVTVSCDNKECAQYGIDIDDQEVLAEAYGGVVSYGLGLPSMRDNLLIRARRVRVGQSRLRGLGRLRSSIAWSFSRAWYHSYRDNDHRRPGPVMGSCGI